MVQRLVTAALAAILVVPARASAAQPAAHDKAYWQAVQSREYAVPEEAPLPALLAELSGYLGSTDSELRDDIAYSTLANWIYRRRIVPEPERRALMEAWLGNLSRGAGERGTTGVLQRSFSALSLSVLVALDNEAPYLTRAEFQGLLAGALQYLRDERDVRGYDERLGWIHSVAHTADLLKFLARSRHVRPVDQASVLAALTAKLEAVEAVLVDGEHERLARAALSIAARDDFDEAAFAAWAAALGPPARRGTPTTAERAADQNRRHFAVALYAVLSADRRELPTVGRARTLVLEALRAFM